MVNTRCETTNKPENSPRKSEIPGMYINDTIEQQRIINYLLLWYCFTHNVESKCNICSNYFNGALCHYNLYVRICVWLLLSEIQTFIYLGNRNFLYIIHTWRGNVQRFSPARTRDDGERCLWSSAINKHQILLTHSMITNLVYLRLLSRCSFTVDPSIIFNYTLQYNIITRSIIIDFSTFSIAYKHSRGLCGVQIKWSWSVYRRRPHDYLNISLP